MVEQWKAIPSYEGIYEVSDMGNVRRVAKRQPCMISPNKVRGYYGVSLRKNGIKKPFYIHRLVMATFVSPCPPECEVNHKNGDKEDNRLSNLEYLSHRANRLYSFRVLDKHGWKLTDTDVQSIRSALSQGARQVDLAAKFGVTRQTIWGIHHQRKWRIA